MNSDPPTGDEENPHDQLPSPEEYRANMDDGSMSSMRDNPQDGDDVDDDHDLPTVDEYKSNMSFRESEERPKSRAGLWTFLCLLILLIIITAIAVPLALRGKGGKGKSADAASSGDGFTGSDTGNRITATPAMRPTRPPTRPPTESSLPRSERAEKFLTEFGIADPADLANPNSPQAKATNWIANDDAFNIDIPDPLQGNNGLQYSDTRFTERWALAVFYYSTGGESWIYKFNFLQPIDHCGWYDRFVDGTGRIIRQGVTECQKFEPNFDIDKVSRIEITNNNLSGNIPSEIKHLPNLQTFSTPFNGLMGSSLDPFLQLSGSLSHLEVQYCKITGQIPDNFGSMSNLISLGLGNNLITGTIPLSFFELSNLVVLGIDDNMLEASIQSFGAFTKMKKLYIEDNLINGQITEGMITNGWQGMVDLDVSFNRMDGPLPSNLFSMKDLEVVDIHGNDFVGKIPEVGPAHENLSFFAVQDNSLTGNLPESIVNAINLKHLDITANQMTLPFPSTMGQLTSLVSLHTGINGFGDHAVPEFLGSMTNLEELSMKQNSLTGQIPSFLGQLTTLIILDLDFNKLNGEIPAELGNLNNLDHLLLNRNFLNGTIPSSFSGLTDIDIMLLDGNEISGDASIICENPDINMTAFSADCGNPDPEIACSCCTICCSNGDPDCNNKEWRVNLDGIWEYDFQRLVYQFSDELLPSGAKDAYVDRDGDGRL